MGPWRAGGPCTPPSITRTVEDDRECSTPNHQHTVTEVVESEQQIQRTPRHQQPPPTRPQTPYAFLRQLQVNAASAFNYMTMRVRGVSVHLEMGAFADHWQWKFVEFLRDQTWSAWSAMAREAKRLQILTEYRQRCRNDDEEQLIISWFNSTWTHFKE